MTLVFIVGFFATFVSSTYESIQLYQQLNIRALDPLVVVLTKAYWNGLIALALIGLISIAALVDLVQSRKISRRFERITEVIARFSEGHTQHRVEVRTSDPIGRLGSAFNRMADIVVDNLEKY